MNKEFFNLLFDHAEGICIGDAKAIKISTDIKRDGEFFSINPLDNEQDHAFFLKDYYREDKPRRADFNVTCFRNFIFEIDSIPLEDQLIILNNSSIPFSAITYSGGKSYHAIVSVDGGVLTGEEHSVGGVNAYKDIWRRLCAKLNREALDLGYEYPENGKTFFDASTKNPSRLSRIAGVTRSNGNEQKLYYLGERISREDFDKILETCPKVSSTISANFKVEWDQLHTVEQFELAAPQGLIADLKFCHWASDSGMYGELYRLALWAFDSTNISYDAFLEFLHQYTFKSLMKRGYPANKLEIGIEHGFNEYTRKRRVKNEQ